MRENGLQRGVDQGALLVGTWVTMIRNPAIMSLLKAVGADFVRVDMEHTGMSMETIADMALMARSIDLPMVVRPPAANREWITRLLDVGVWNILCPQVESSEHAAAIVAASRYAPMGCRGIGGLGPAMDFLPPQSAAEHRMHANRQVFITVMLETARAFEDLDAIAAMDGIDALTLGPGDLAQELRVAGTADEARIVDSKRDEIFAACRKHGKTAAMLVGDPAQVRRYIEAGVTMFTYSSDVEILHSGFRRAVASIRAA